MNTNELSLVQLIEIAQLYSSYSTGELITAISKAESYDYAQTGDDFYSITKFEIIEQALDYPDIHVKRLITKRKPNIYSQPTSLMVTLKDIYGTDSVEVPSGYRAIGLGFVEPGKPYLPISSSYPFTDDFPLSGTIRLKLERLT